MFCIHGGRPLLKCLKEPAPDAGDHFLGSLRFLRPVCRRPKPNPTRATPVHKVITGKPIINVPGARQLPR